MAEYLPFWPKAGVGGYVANGGGTAVFYSKVMPTNGFKEVVVQMEIDATFGASLGPVYTTVDVAPQISNDGMNWHTLTATSLSIANNDAFPAQATEKFTEIGAFMRMKITITNNEADGLSHWIIATVIAVGAGRS